MCFNYQEKRTAGGKVFSHNHGGLCCVLCIGWLRDRLTLMHFNSSEKRKADDMVCESLGALLCIGNYILTVLLYTGGSQSKEEEGGKFKGFCNL
jgi:hypothetical protein